jgi:PH domain
VSTVDAPTKKRLPEPPARRAMWCTAREPWWREQGEDSATAGGSGVNETIAQNTGRQSSRDLDAAETGADCHSVQGFLRSGWLRKQGLRRKSWKRRFFGLSHSSLLYFAADRTSEKPLGEIPLVLIARVTGDGLHENGRRIGHAQSLGDNLLDDVSGGGSTSSPSQSQHERSATGPPSLTGGGAGGGVPAQVGRRTRGTRALASSDSSIAVGAGQADTSRGWGFKIHTEKRTFLVVAASEREREVWVEAIGVMANFVRGVRAHMTLTVHPDLAATGPSQESRESTTGRSRVRSMFSRHTVSGSADARAAAAETGTAPSSAAAPPRPFAVRLAARSFEITHSGAHVLESFRILQEFCQGNQAVETRRIADLSNLIPTFRDALFNLAKAMVSAFGVIGREATGPADFEGESKRVRAAADAVRSLGFLMHQMVAATDTAVPHATVLLHCLELVEIRLREFRTAHLVVIAACHDGLNSEVRKTSATLHGLAKPSAASATIATATATDDDSNSGGFFPSAHTALATIRQQTVNIRATWRDLRGDSEQYDNVMPSARSAEFAPIQLRASEAWFAAIQWLKDQASEGAKVVPADVWAGQFERLDAQLQAIEEFFGDMLATWEEEET